MTDREKAIVMAYTGIAMLKGDKLDEFYDYLEELYGRPVYTHELVELDITEKAKPDFIKLCAETHDKRLETHGDVISRAEAIDDLRRRDPSQIWDTADIEVWINDLPSAQPERKTGRWIGHKADDPDWQRDDGTPIMLMCSVCKAFVINNGASGWNYCPNCGSYNGGEE